VLAAYSTAKAQKMMTLEAAKFRSRKGRKLTTGLGWRNSQTISATRPTTNKIANVCTRPNGSPSQSHSWPLLSITSQQTMTMTSSDSPTPSNLNGRLRNSLHC
jgi:hypothetical protein